MSFEIEDTLVLWPRISTAEAALRPTRAEIDLEAITHNFRVLASLVPGTRVLAVVKADAYGHGVVPVARTLEAAGAFGFGVALAEEGLELRDAGVRGAILVLNGVHGRAHRDIVERGLTPVVYEEREARAFASLPGDSPVGIHLKIDTGMSRLGVPHRELDAFLDRLEALRRLRIDGVMTHLASADVDPEFTALQLARFGAALDRLRERGHRPSIVHAANSPATFRHPEARFDMVRTGLALFGYAGADEVSADLRPAMRLRSEIISLRDLDPGETVGYCGTFRAERRTRVATVPIGYGDGYFRAFSNRGSVLVRGVRCPVVGNVSMDLTGIDVTDLPEVAIGDEVVYLGSQGADGLSAVELAARIGTIPYEILTNVSRRVPRFYAG